MADKVELKKYLNTRFPNWNLSIQNSGVATWINLDDGNLFFLIQMTPSEGVGVSVVDKLHEVDMSGHDEVFDNIEKAVIYMENIKSSRIVK